MGKVKSAICLCAITLILAVLCFVCFVPFPTGSGGISYYNPIINWAEKSEDLGGFQFGGEDPAYIGGSYSIMLYPEGVISSKEYESNLRILEGDDRTEYEGKYTAHAGGALYLSNEDVMDGGRVTQKFSTSFEKRLELLKERFSRLNTEGTSIEVVNDYSVRVTMPASTDVSVASFLYFGYMGDLEVSFGTDLESAGRIFPETNKPITDYMKGADTRSMNGTQYVVLHFTNEGQKLISTATATAESSGGTLFFTVGGEQVIGLSVSSRLNEKDLYISGDYSSDAAKILSTVIDTSVDFASDSELGKLEMGELYRNQAGFGKSALMFVYLALAVSSVAGVVFFFIRYRRLGFAHLYSFLFFLLAMLLCVWWIPTLTIGMNTLTAFILTAVLLSVSNAVAFENARKEYALGKTMTSSVKTGYKKCFWHLFEVHAVVGGIGLLIWGIALSELSAFGLTLALGALFSAIATLAFNRFMWFVMMSLAKNQGKFCHFVREVDDDEE